jgi:hypothetical protein
MKTKSIDFIDLQANLPYFVLFALIFNNTITTIKKTAIFSTDTDRLMWVLP